MRGRLGRCALATCARCPCRPLRAVRLPRLLCCLFLFNMGCFLRCARGRQRQLSVTPRPARTVADVVAVVVAVAVAVAMWRRAPQQPACLRPHYYRAMRALFTERKQYALYGDMQYVIYDGRQPCFRFVGFI